MTERKAKHITEKSSDRFPRTAEVARAHPDEWYPDNRNPWKDLYTPSIMDQIGRIVGLRYGSDLDALCVSLCMVGQTYVVVKEGIELDRTRKERLDWIDKNLIGPATALRTALLPQSMRIASHYPDEYYVKDHKAREQLVATLSQLIHWANERKGLLAVRPKYGRKPATQYRLDLVFALMEVYVRHFPARAPKRISNPGSRPIESEFARFVRAAAAPILKREDRLDDQIKTAVQTYRRMKNKVT